MTVKYTIYPVATQNMAKVQQTVTLLWLNVFSMVYGTQCDASASASTSTTLLKVACPFLAQPNLGTFTVAHSFLHNFPFLKKGASFQQFVDAHNLLHKYGKFEDVCTFVTEQANLSNFTNGVRCFAQFNFFRILLTKGAYFKETQSCAGCFDANAQQNHTCAECFAQVLSKTTFQSFRQVFDLKTQFRQNCSCLTVFHNL